MHEACSIRMHEAGSIRRKGEMHEAGSIRGRTPVRGEVLRVHGEREEMRARTAALRLERRAVMVQVRDHQGHQLTWG